MGCDGVLPVETSPGIPSVTATLRPASVEALTWDSIAGVEETLKLRICRA